MMTPVTSTSDVEVKVVKELAHAGDSGDKNSFSEGLEVGICFASPSELEVV